MKSFAGRHPWFVRFGATFLVLVGFGIVWVRARMQGPFRDYRADVEVVSGPASTKGEAFEVGVGVREITPRMEQYDSWKDVDGNGKFQTDKGDTWEDRNGNGDFDFVWLAGFDVNRPAQGVNDPLWARALAFRHRSTTVAVVSVDCVGLTHERIIEVRLKLKAELPVLTHLVLSSTHTHNGPDTMGIWSYRPIAGKFDERYVASVLEAARAAVVDAVKGLQPTRLTYGTAAIPPGGFVRDSRDPQVTDRSLGVARFARIGADETIATLVSWGNHPEAMGGSNPLVSSDFPHYLREAMEKGLAGTNGMQGFGGTCVFLQGPVGGLMTPLGITVPDRDGHTLHKENGVGKTRALGENLALRAAAVLRGAEARTMTDGRIAVAAQSVFVPIEGTFRIPIMLGLIHPGWYDGKAKTEVGALRVGEIELLTIPGEIYPEIVDGGVETPEGGDFPGPAQEVPPLRSEMKGGMNLVLNLANDEIGYIVPRTQWDTRPPYTYGRKNAPYGEVNSGGPDVATVMHRESLGVLARLRVLLGK